MLSRYVRISMLLTVAAMSVALTLTGSTAASSEAQAAGREVAGKVVFPGLGVRVWRASGQLDRLARTSPGFRHAIRDDLDRVWGWSGNDPDCAQAPIAIVKEYRPRVAYVSDLGSFAGGPGSAPDKCAGGGAWQFVLKRDGHWKSPTRLGGQDTVECRNLRHFQIPRMHGSTRCWNGQQIVRWDP